jgi:DNA replication initiation complex subunit (GINS family)
MEYNDLYELLRKERYAEALQPLSKKFVLEFSKYLKEMRESSSGGDDLFSDSGMSSKKQLENSIVLFRSLILRRKRKLLNLVFVAAETGIMKKDYDHMLNFEKGVFDKLVSAFEGGDKELAGILNGEEGEKDEKNKMVIFGEAVEEFVDMDGKTIGPFEKGDLANLDPKVCEVLVGGKKASFVDEN